jgi:hypothetical protein
MWQTRLLSRTEVTRTFDTQQVAAVDRPKRCRALGSLRGLRPLRRQLSFGVRFT